MAAPHFLTIRVALENLGRDSELIMAAYATSGELTKRYDWRIIGQFCQDDNAELSRADIESHENVAQALEDASGEIEAALRVGGQYNPTDLAALTGNALAHLERITCTLAVAALIRRRISKREDENVQPILDEAREHLDALRKGQNVFAIDANIEAGYIKTESPTLSIIKAQNTLPERLGRHMPSRGQALPTNKQV